MMHEKITTTQATNNSCKMKTVAIVAPTRSNSLDYLNFQEKRQLIASSLSLSDFLSVGNNTTKEIKDGVATVIVGEFDARFFQGGNLAKFCKIDLHLPEHGECLMSFNKIYDFL